MGGDQASVLVLEAEQDVANPSGVGGGDDDPVGCPRGGASEEGEAAGPTEHRPAGMASGTTTDFASLTVVKPSLICTTIAALTGMVCELVRSSLNAVALFSMM